MRRIFLLAASTLLLNLLACHHGSPWTATVNAGFFQQVDYDPGQRLLTIHFTDGSVYAYQRVPENVFDDLVGSSSPADVFNEFIRDRYPFELIHVRTQSWGIPRVPLKRAADVQAEFPCTHPGQQSRKPVKSVILDFASYDSADRCMILYFDKGDVYEYGNVPQKTFSALIHSPHVDKFFNREIWGKFPKRRTQRR